MTISYLFCNLHPASRAYNTCSSMKRKPIVDFLTCTVALFSFFSQALAANTNYFFDPDSCLDIVDRTNIDVQIQRAALIASYVNHMMSFPGITNYLDPFLGAPSSESSNLNAASSIFVGGETRVNNNILPQRIEGVASYTKGRGLFTDVKTAGNLVRIRAL